MQIEGCERFQGQWVFRIILGMVVTFTRAADQVDSHVLQSKEFSWMCGDCF